MDPPSGELLRALSMLGLADPRELNRARSTVRRFTRGLPAYDSVWIDALVRHHQLTLFQARKLDQKQADDLLLGDRIVLRTQRHVDPLFPVYEAQDRDRSRRWMVGQIRSLPGDAAAAGKRMQELLARLKSMGPLPLPLPVEFLQQGELFSIVSPWKEGDSLGNYLVRRGRFPEPVVRDLAAAIVMELARCNEPHGDLRLSNVWLMPTGTPVLWHHGILNAVIPQITIHTPLPLDALDGIAPERIETGQPATTASDIYGLGCLLWQMLAGRSPFLTNDPLARLQCHRLKRVEDVRRIAPLTSPELAQLIHCMTAREPGERPDCGEILKSLRGQKTGVVAVRQFVRSFESAAPRRTRSERPRWKNRIAGSLAAGLMLAAALTAWNRDRLGLPGIPRVSAAMESFRTKTKPAAPSIETVEPWATAEAPAPFASISPSLPPIPQPDAAGVIALHAGQRYDAGSVSGTTLLHVRSENGEPATIVIGNQPLVLDAQQVLLENVRIVVEPNSASDVAEAPLRVTAEELTLNRVQMGAIGEDAGPVVEWQEPAAPGPMSGRLRITHSLLLPGTSIACRTELRGALLQNVYREGAGPLLKLSNGVPSGLKISLLLYRCTLRESGPLVELPSGEVLASGGRLSIGGSETVASLLPDAGLMEFPDVPPVGWEDHVEIFAKGVFLPSEALLVAARVEAGGASQPVNPSRMTIDGVLSGEFSFVEEPGIAHPLQRLRIESLPVQSGDRLPGVDPALFPELQQQEKEAGSRSDPASG